MIALRVRSGEVHKLSQATVLKAEENYYYDYWFTPDAVYRVRIIPYGLVLLANLGAAAAVVLLARVLPPILLPVPFAIFALPYFGLKRMAKKKRRLRGSFQAGRIPENHEMSRKIRWEEIKSVSLIRRRYLRISAGIHTYRGTIKNQDYEPLKNFLLSKIGDGLKVREETF